MREARRRIHAVAPRRDCKPRSTASTARCRRQSVAEAREYLFDAEGQIGVVLNDARIGQRPRRVLSEFGDQSRE